MSWPLSLINALLGAGVVFALVPVILHYSPRANLDRRTPDLHHMHKASVPRLGGMALAAAFLVINLASLLFFPRTAKFQDAWIFPVTSLAMFGLGLWDDLRPLGAKWKLMGQVLIALVACCSGVAIMTFKIPFSGQIISLGGWGVLITVVWLVAMTNLINLIDGVDGLAGGISLMLMGLLAYVGHQNGNFELVAAGMAGALLGFLWFNFPPARIYLGDGGAYFLGFQIGLLALVGSQKGTIVAALVAPLFVLALPIVDMLLAILRRGLRGLPIFRPDRKHIHHRLLEIGFSPRRAVLSIYALTLVFLVLGFLAFVSEGQWVPTLLGIVILLILLCARTLNFSREWFAVGRVLGNSLEMRKEIQYALSLTRWLALEGAWHPSLESLWLDLVFVVQRLGFTSLRLTLANGVRVWERSKEGSGPMLLYRQELRGGVVGVLELQAPDIKSAGATSPAGDHSPAGGPPFCLHIHDPKLFQILSELVAESCLKATKQLGAGTAGPIKLQFDTVDPQQSVPVAAGSSY